MTVNIDTPEARTPVGAYVMIREEGGQLWVAGHGPFLGAVQTHRGKLGSDLTVAEGKVAARNAALNALASVKTHLGGSLERVTGVIRLFGMVNATPDFTDQPAVIDGASELLLEVFGDRGRHTRCAVGMGSLPFGMPVELEMVLSLR